MGTENLVWDKQHNQFGREVVVVRRWELPQGIVVGRSRAGQHSCWGDTELAADPRLGRARSDWVDSLGPELRAVLSKMCCMAVVDQFAWSKLAAVGGNRMKSSLMKGGHLEQLEFLAGSN